MNAHLEETNIWKSSAYAYCFVCTGKRFFC